ALNANYGLLWWLNTGCTRYPSAPAASFFASGAGGNITFVSPEHDIVAIMRWMDRDSTDQFLRMMLAALRH
ncbi:MAG TPA: serine hydrolase, partial [Acetobacteraceae bacterium]|nr:serine hydrolase [Acetobacteraceae bacterium]